MDQYFTKNELLLDGLIDCIGEDVEGLDILEPSAGEGDIVKNCFGDIENVTMVELDPKLVERLKMEFEKCEIICGDFLKLKFDDKRFDLIVSNPPFTYTAEFIEKCFDLLKPRGKMVFIVQDNTLKLTSNIDLLKRMNQNGVFERVIKYSDERLFEGASVPVIIFSYVKTKIDNEKYCLYSVDNGEPKEMIYEINPIFNFKTSSVKVGDLFSIHVGYVSGADGLLRTNERDNTINILKKKDVVETFWDFKNEEDANDVLSGCKTKLMNRKIKKFNENNWFEFGLKRNENIIIHNHNKPCLYMYNQTRQDEICFVGVVQPFGGNLLLLLPKRDIDLNYYENVFNGEWKKRFITDGNRFRISHKQLETSYV